MNWTEVTIWSPWIVQSPQLWGAPALPNLRVRVNILFIYYFLLLGFPSSSKSAIISYCNVCAHQVILHQEILLLWGQRHRVENPKPPLSSLNQHPPVYLLTVRERLPPRCPPHRVYPALQNVPNSPPLLQSVLWDDLLMLQVWTKGQYHPQ